jgi:hypothetical protein
LQEMDGAVVGVDDELAVGPLEIFVSADQEFQRKLFEHKIVGGFKFIIGKWTEDGAWFGDVLNEKFVGEVGAVLSWSWLSCSSRPAASCAVRRGFQLGFQETVK